MVSDRATAVTVRPRHIAETDCVAGHIGYELRCAK
jgi:hypothetical protein